MMRLSGWVWTAFLVCVQLASAQNLSTPVAGTILDEGGRLLSLTGVAGNLLPGQTIPGVTGGEPIVTAAFSSTGGALKTDSRVLLLDAGGNLQSAREAPGGPALFGFGSDGSVQWACFPNARQCQSLAGNQLLDTNGWGDGVAAVGAVSENTVGVLVTKGGQLWSETVAADTGAISSQMPVSGATPAAYFEGGWLTTGTLGLLWQPALATAEVRRIAVPGPISTLQAAGAHAIAINGRLLLIPDWRVLEIPRTPPVRPLNIIRPPVERDR